MSPEGKAAEPMAKHQAGRHVSKRAQKAEQQVGDAVRRLRAAQRLSVRTLASKSGFSASFISQVELGQASPSIASLDRIAAALGVSLGEFFQQTATTGPAIIKSTERHALQSKWSHARIETLAPSSAGNSVEAILVTLRTGGASGARLHAHETDLFAMVLDGKVLLSLQDAAHTLVRGDAVTIPAGVRHRWQNRSAKPAVILKVTARLHPTLAGAL